MTQTYIHYVKGTANQIQEKNLIGNTKNTMLPDKTSVFDMLYVTEMVYVRKRKHKISIRSRHLDIGHKKTILIPGKQQPDY